MSDIRTITWDEDERQVYAQEYALRSGISLALLGMHGRVALPCDCGGKICDGWQMGRADDVEKWFKFAGRKRSSGEGENDA